MRFDSHEGEEHTSRHSRQGYDHLCNLEPFRSTRPRCSNQALAFFILWKVPM